MPASKTTKAALEPSKSQRQSLADCAHKFSVVARKLGTEYLVNGNIEKVRYRDGEVQGHVRVEQTYKVSWKCLDDIWQNHCTCSMGANCEHAYAVAHHLLQYGIEEKPSSSTSEPGLSNDRLDRLLSLVGNSGKGNGSSNLNHKSVVSKILESRNCWDAQQHIPSLLAQLDIKTDPESKHWVAFVESENPKKRAWLLARELLKFGEKLPPELEAYRLCENFEKEERKEKEEQFLEMVQDWVQLLPHQFQKVDRSIRVVWSWDPNVYGSGPQIQILVTGKKLKDSLRTLSQVRAFAADVLHDQNLFNEADAYFLRWLDARFQVLISKSTGTEPECFSNSDYALLEWLNTWGKNQRCAWDDGSPVSFDEAPCQIVPEVGFSEKNGSSTDKKGNQTPVFNLIVELADGRKFPFHEVRIVFPRSREDERQPIFVFVDKMFYRVCSSPPIKVLEQFIELGKLQLTKERRVKFLPDLLRSFPRISEDSKGLIRYHPVKVLISLSLLPTDWITVKLKAVSVKSSMEWDFTVRGWIREQGRGKKESRKDEEWQQIVSSDESVLQAQNSTQNAEENSQGEFLEEFPDPNITQPVQNWLESLGVDCASDAGFETEEGWWLSLDSKKVEYFLELWKKRPFQAEYWANQAFRALVNRMHHQSPKFKIQSSGVDWFTISAEWTSFVNQLTAKDLESLQNTEEKFVRLSSGNWITKEEGEQIKNTLDALSELGLDPASQTPQKLSLWHIASAGSEAIQKFSNLLSDGELIEENPEIREIKEKFAQFKGIPDVSLPSRLRASMRTYQVEGLKFLAYLSSLRFGAILADDMGLGKTLQALSWLEHLRDIEGPAPSLVICPASVVYNWCREAQKFVTDASVLLLTSGEERHSLRKEIPKHDLVITNYALLRRDLNELKQFEFRAIVLDEAQNIKNPDSRVAQSAKELKAVHRLALTGTPLENRLLDLWSIVDFVCPGYLSNRNRFTELYDQPDQPHRRRMLKSRLRPILLRRIKKDVAPDLPDRIEERHDCELTDEQRKLYVTELNRVRDFVKNLQDTDQLAQKKIHVLAALTRLRQICCHPNLLGAEHQTGSGKSDALFEIVEPLIAEGHKVLIFSQFVEMLNILEKDLKERGISYHMLTGRTTKREAVVEAFQQDPNPCVFLLSLRAAGTGLNLTSASYVILYDPWWNPAVEAQAIDRTHRIGQDRTVITYRLVTKDTVEDKIFQLQQSKSAMVKDVLGEEGFSRSLTKEDLDFIFSP